MVAHKVTSRVVALDRIPERLARLACQPFLFFAGAA